MILILYPHINVMKGKGKYSESYVVTFTGNESKAKNQ